MACPAMGVVEGLLRFTLGTVHALVWLKESTLYSLLWLWTAVTYAVKHKGTKLECVQEDTRQLKKIPSHLALMIHEEDMSHTDLARIVTWAFASGIHNVSIYNAHGKVALLTNSHRLHCHGP